MATKRPAENGTELRFTRNKRAKTTRMDPSVSQHGAFGDLENGTTAPGDSDLDCEDDSEALAYLKTVRTQASTIPHVLVAKHPTVPPPPISAERGDGSEECDEAPDASRTIYETGVGDFRGYYQDGAYISYPDDYWDDEGEEEEFDEEDADNAEKDQASDNSELGEDRPRNSSADEIRDAYFAAITNRFKALRTLLTTEPPGTAVHGLPPSNPYKVAEWKRGVGSFRTWENRLRGTDPIPAQIASMHKDSVFRLLRIILAGKFLRKRQELRERTSRWIWALLARLPDQGELDYQEVGWIRELGKRAVLMLVSLTELELLREHCDVAKTSPDEEEFEVDGDVDENFEDEDQGQNAPVDVESASSPIIPEEKPQEEAEQPEMSTGNEDCGPPLDDKVDSGPSSNAAVGTQEPHKYHSDVEMQLDSEMEDGEVADDPHSPSAPPPRRASDPTADDDVEAAKARLLAQLNGDGLAEGDDVVAQEQGADDEAGTYEEEEEEGAEDEDEDGYHERYEELDRSKINERATFNMILTVAGELYGQRDLLEFRNPFGGLHFG
ncbi:hypothetical protein F5Y17DRAFT_430757 [Xylariaceae sp. FL0594]|nr:hypothetical protein F5Y17DRAFT_430757 [Xylariaceae sp. FL0594]